MGFLVLQEYQLKVKNMKQKEPIRLPFFIFEIGNFI